MLVPLIMSQSHYIDASEDIALLVARGANGWHDCILGLRTPHVKLNLARETTAYFGMVLIVLAVVDCLNRLYRFRNFFFFQEIV